MIKVKITKNVVKAKGGMMLSVGQIIAGTVGVIIGLITFFALKDFMNINVLLWIIFCEIVLVVGFGAVKIDGMSLFGFLIKSLKGVDKRPYSNNKGVFKNDKFNIF